MKTYWSIPGPHKAASKGEQCLAFYKYDGSNIRAEWNRKQGWYKFGTRRRLFDKTDHEYGRAIDLFLERYGEALPKIFQTNKNYKGRDQIIAFCEFYGEESFAGYHNFEKPFEVTLIDVEVHKKGFVLPRQFVDDFAPHVPVAPVVYEGRFDNDFVEQVIANKLEVSLLEGVVAKGSISGRNPQHSLWMAKVKTRWWLDELRKRAEYIADLRQVLEENEKEQKR
jgi:hypothetical protein